MLLVYPHLWHRHKLLKYSHRMLTACIRVCLHSRAPLIWTPSWVGLDCPALRRHEFTATAGSAGPARVDSYWLASRAGLKTRLLAGDAAAWCRRRLSADAAQPLRLEAVAAAATPGPVSAVCVSEWHSFFERHSCPSAVRVRVPFPDTCRIRVSDGRCSRLSLPRPAALRRQPSSPLLLPAALAHSKAPSRCVLRRHVFKRRHVFLFSTCRSQAAPGPCKTCHDAWPRILGQSRPGGPGQSRAASFGRA